MLTLYVLKIHCLVESRQPNWPPRLSAISDTELAKNGGGKHWFGFPPPPKETKSPPKLVSESLCTEDG